MFRKLTCFSVNILVINVIACILSLCVRYSIVEIGFYRNEEITKGNGGMMVGVSLGREEEQKKKRKSVLSSRYMKMADKWLVCLNYFIFLRSINERLIKFLRYSNLDCRSIISYLSYISTPNTYHI